MPLDTTPPIIDITIPATNPFSTTTTPLAISGSVSDPESSITTVAWSNDRGGSGLASGTTAWSASISLTAGTNHIVITAINSVSLISTDSVDVVYTPADMVDPVVNITFPPTDPYGTNSSSITITGTSSDNVGVNAVNWMNMTTEQSGAAAGTGSWSAGPMSLFAGTNDILITAADAAGNSATDSVQVVYTSLDVQNPVVTITSPTGVATYDTRSSPIPLSGTASDDVGVTGVVWANNRGGSGAAAGTSSWSVAAATLQPGVNVITVTASDASAKSGNDALTVTYDNGAPTIQITGPTSAVTYTINSSPLTLSGTASDTGTSVVAVTWSNDSGGSGTAAGTTSWTAAGINLQPGANAITVTATDQLGNQSVDQITVTYDNTDPTVSISSPTAAATYQTTVSPLTMSGTSTGTGTPVVQVLWANDRGGSGAAAGTGSWIASGVINLQPGINVLTITAEDGAGNTNTDTLTVTYDNVDPTVTITSPTASAALATGSATIPLGGTASDTGTSVTSVTWVNDRGGSGTASGTTSWTVASVNLFNGDNVITVTATDELGNTGTNILTVTYTPADIIDPTISITSPTAAPAYTAASTPISLGGTASDNTSVTQVLWSNDHGGSGAAAGTAAWTIPAVNLSLGSNVITVTAWDAANNTTSDTLTVDYSPPDMADPTVTITTPAADPHYTNTGSLVMSGNASDDISLAQVRWANDRGGSGTATGTDSWSATVTGLSEGTNIITVTAEDWAGKTGTDTVTVVYDPAAPTVTITSPTAEATLDTKSTTIDISGTATDNLGVDQILWSNDRGGSGAAAGTASWSVNGIPLQTGQNVITITATDATGNTGIDTLTVNPAEFTGPSFAGPFFVGRMELQFTVDDPKTPGVVFSPGSPGQATVPRNYEGLGAHAIVTYNASGVLQGEWLVDGQVLGTVNQMLYPGRSEAIIAFPVVPGLPTYDTGIHRVELRVNEPSPAFDEPAISYFVSAQETPGPLPTLTLLYPADNGSAPLVPGTLMSPNFRWAGMGPEYTYRIALTGRSKRAVVRALPGGGIPPVVIAETPFAHYNLSIFDTGRLLTGTPYIWTVSALRSGRPEAMGGPRTFTFTAPVPVGEGLVIRDLAVSDEGGQPLEAAGQPGDGRSTGFTPVPRYLTARPQPLTIIGLVKNESGEDERNLRVEFTADGDIVDVAFLVYLPAGTQEQVTGFYDMPDSDSHELKVRVIDQGGIQLAAADALIDTTSIEGGEEGASRHAVDTANLTMTGLATGEAMVIDTDPLTMTGVAAGEAMVINTDPLTMTGVAAGEAMVIDTAPLTMKGVAAGEAMVINIAPLTMKGVAAGEAMVIDTAPLTMTGTNSGEAMIIDTLPLTMTGW